MRAFEVEVHGKFGVLPVKKEDGSVGYDISLPTNSGNLVLAPNTRRRIDTGIIIRPPEKCFTLIVPRSSVSKKGVRFSNTVGIVDPSYSGQDDTIKVDITRGERIYHYHGQINPKDKGETIDRGIKRYVLEHGLQEGYFKKGFDSETGIVHIFVSDDTTQGDVIYRAGERFCQVLFIPYHSPELVERSLEAFSDDNRGGFGSTGQT